jgi:hypothetical protein
MTNFDGVIRPRLTSARLQVLFDEGDALVRHMDELEAWHTSRGTDCTLDPRYREAQAQAESVLAEIQEYEEDPKGAPEADDSDTYYLGEVRQAITRARELGKRRRHGR